MSPSRAAQAAFCEQQAKYCDRPSPLSVLYSVDQLAERAEMFRSIAASLQQEAWPVDAARTVLCGFDVGVFVRSHDNDNQPGWQIRLLPYLQALAALQRAVDEVPGGPLLSEGRAREGSTT